MIAVSIGLMTGDAHAAMPHPLTVGLRTIEIACVVEGRDSETNRSFEVAFCEELSRRVGEKLGVAVVRMDDAGPAVDRSLPRAATAWIRSAVRLDAEAAIARTSWGSHMPQRGVPPIEEGPPVSLRLEGSTIAADGRALAGAVVAKLPFMPNE
ncbi:MAG: hypothetical protein Q8P46_12745 [Hyphomicrobiales bacterium]|nr:hypothetical protein [Hyphomicrobiales bacterium]